MPHNEHEKVFSRIQVVPFNQYVYWVGSDGHLEQHLNISLQVSSSHVGATSIDASPFDSTTSTTT